MIKTLTNQLVCFNREEIQKAKSEGYKFLLVYVRKEPIRYDYTFYSDSREYYDAVDALEESGEGRRYFAVDVRKIITD